jgi:hypothetical protein
MTQEEEPLPTAWSTVSRQLASRISGALAGVCIIVILAMLGLGSHQLDAPLRHSLLAFMIALPLLVLSMCFVLVRVNGVIAYMSAIVGGLAVEYGTYEVLFHLDEPTNQIFIGVTNACLLLFVVAGSITIRQRRGSQRSDRKR